MLLSFDKSGIPSLSNIFSITLFAFESLLPLKPGKTPNPSAIFNIFPIFNELVELSSLPNSTDAVEKLSSIITLSFFVC